MMAPAMPDEALIPAKCRTAIAAGGGETLSQTEGHESCRSADG